MKHTEQVEIPAKTGTRVTRTTCDICGEEIVQAFGVAQAEVSLADAMNYGEDRFDNELEFDICARCFREKLVPWVSSHRGAKPRVSKCDW